MFKEQFDAMFVVLCTQSSTPEIWCDFCSCDAFMVMAEGAYIRLAKIYAVCIFITAKVNTLSLPSSKQGL